MITTIFTGIGDGATGFVGMLKNILMSIIDLFGTTSPETGAFTLNVLGVLTLCVAGVGFGYMGIRWITRLITLRRAG